MKRSLKVLMTALAALIVPALGWAEDTLPKPVLLLDFGATDATNTSTDTWIKHTQAGGDAISPKITGYTATFATSSGGNFYANNVTVNDKTADFTEGDYVDLKGNIHTTVFAEMAATLGLKGSIDTSIYQDGLGNGGQRGHTVTIGGLDSEKTYVLYYVAGGLHNTGANRILAGFKLTGYAGSPKLDYVVTGAATGTTVAASYQTVASSGTLIRAAANAYMVARVSYIQPNTNGQITFLLNQDDGYYAGINALAIAEIEPLPEHTRSIDTADDGEAWSATDKWTNGTLPVATDIVNLKAAVDGAKLTIDTAAVANQLTIRGEHALTMTGTGSLTVGTSTSINTDTDVSAIKANLGAVTITEGKTLTVGANTTITSIAGKGELFVDSGVTIAPGSLADFSGSLAGSGTVVIDKVANLPAASIVSGEWTGTVKVTCGSTTVSLTDQLAKLCNTNSVLELDGCSGHFSNGTNLETTVRLTGNGLKLTNGSSGGTSNLKTTITKLTGDGAFTTEDPSASKVWKYTLIVKDASEFTGSIDVASTEAVGTAIVIGDTAENTGAAANGKIVVSADKTAIIASGKTWATKNDLIVSGTLGGSGSITGNLTFADGATLNATNGALTVTGAVTLPETGTVNVAVADGATAGDAVLTCASITGLDTATVAVSGVDGLTVAANEAGTALVLVNASSTTITDAAGLIKAVKTAGEYTLGTGITLSETLVIDVGEGNAVTINLNGNYLSASSVTAVRIESGILNLVATTKDGWEMVASYGPAAIEVGADEDGNPVQEACVLNVDAGINLMGDVDVASGTIAGSCNLTGNLILAADTTLDVSSGTLTIATGGTVTLPETGTVNVAVAEGATAGATVLTCATAGIDPTKFAVSETMKVVAASDEESLILAEIPIVCKDVYGFYSFDSISAAVAYYQEAENGYVALQLLLSPNETVTLPEGYLLVFASVADGVSLENLTVIDEYGTEIDSTESDYGPQYSTPTYKVSATVGGATKKYATLNQAAAAGATAITLLANVEVTGGTADAPLTIAAPVSGDYGITIDSGIVKLNATNTYTGDTIVSGTLSGTGTIAGDLTLAYGAVLDIDGKKALTVNGNVTVGTVGENEEGETLLGLTLNGGVFADDVDYTDDPVLICTNAAEVVDYIPAPEGYEAAVDGTTIKLKVITVSEKITIDGTESEQTLSAKAIAVLQAIANDAGESITVVKVPTEAHAKAVDAALQVFTGIVETYVDDEGDTVADIDWDFGITEIVRNPDKMDQVIITVKVQRDADTPAGYAEDAEVTIYADDESVGLAAIDRNADGIARNAVLEVNKIAGKKLTVKASIDSSSGTGSDAPDVEP